VRNLKLTVSAALGGGDQGELEVDRSREVSACNPQEGAACLSRHSENRRHCGRAGLP
jgi:hypothetical protein